MKRAIRPVLIAAVALAAYVALDSALGDVVDLVFSKGIGQSPERFLALWSMSPIGDVVFVVGSVAAVLVGVMSKTKLGILFAVLITWVTYTVAATATFSLPTFGEGSSSPPRAENFGYWLVGTPIVGLAGLVFTVAALLYARRALARKWFAPLKLTRSTSPLQPPGSGG